MDFEGFIFSWPGHTRNAEVLEAEVGSLMPVTVINSASDAYDTHPHWQHVGEDAYFSAQWNRAVRVFRGEVLFHIQADANVHSVALLCERARHVFDSYNVGVYEPNIVHSDIKYDRERLRRLEPDLYEVPLTDCTCWFIAGELVRGLPVIDTAVNRYGWGICVAIAGLAAIERRLCVKDYGVTVSHPQTRGYPTVVAAQQKRLYLRGLPAPLRNAVANIGRARAQQMP